MTGGKSIGTETGPCYNEPDTEESIVWRKLMKKRSVLLLTVIAGILLVTGCQKKDPNIDIKKLAIGMTKQEVEKSIGTKLTYNLAKKKEQTSEALKLNNRPVMMLVSFENQKATDYTIEFYGCKRDDEISDYITEIFSVEPVSRLPGIYYGDCYQWDVSSNDEVNYKTITLNFTNDEDRTMVDNTRIYISNNEIDQDSIISTEKKEPAITATEAEEILTDYLATSVGISNLKKGMLHDHKWSAIEECDVVTIERNSDEDGYELFRDEKVYFYYYYFTLKGKLKVIDEYGKKETKYYECSADVSDQGNINFDTWYPRMQLVDN